MIKHKIYGALMLGLIGLSLAGCSKKETVQSIGAEALEKLNDIQSINYSTKIDLELSSLVYGEKMKMTYTGDISTDRVLGTGEIHSFSDYSTQAFADRYSEQIESYVKAEGADYNQYATFDGNQFYKVKLTRNQDEDKVGPLGLVAYIIDESNTTDLTWDYIEGKKDNGYVITSIATGNYLKYIVDKTSMSGLIDFKNNLNDKVVAYTTLKLDKNKALKSIKLDFKDTGDVFPSILGGMDQDSVESTMTHFSVDISFNNFNSVSEITLPEGAVNAVETDNINNFSVQVTSNEKVESETYNTVRVGNLKFEVPSNWEELKSGIYKDMFSSGGHGTASKEYKHMYSTSVMKFTGGISLFDWEGKSSLGIVPDSTVNNTDATDTTETAQESEAVETEVANETSESGESTEDVAPIFEIEAKKYLDAKLEAVKTDYDSITLIDGEVPYIIGNKEADGNKSYAIYLTDGRDEFEILVTFDDSNLYKDYYTESLNHLLGSLKLLIDTEEDENYVKVEETAPEKPEISTENTLDNILGSQANPYKLNDVVSINIIDMSTGNIATENIKVSGVLKDKIIVGQKIKEHESKTKESLAEYTSIQLVQFSVSSSGYSYTEDNKLPFNLKADVLKDGKVVESITGTTPLGMTEMTLSENDKESDFIFAYDIDDISHSLVRITYADPDLGDTEVYIELN